MTDFFDREYTAKEAYGRLYHYAVKYRARLIVGLLAGTLTAGAWVPILQVIQPVLQQALAFNTQEVESAEELAVAVEPVEKLNLAKGEEKILNHSDLMKARANDPDLPSTFYKAEDYARKFDISFRDENGALKGALLYIVLIIVIPVVVFKMLVMYINNYYMRWTGAKVVQDFRVDLFRHLQTQSLEFFGRTDVGRIMSRCTSDPQEVERVIALSLAQICRAPFEIIFAFGFMINFAIKEDILEVLAVVFIGFPLFVMPMAFLGNKVHKWAKKAMQRISIVSSRLHENLTCIRVVKAYFTENYEVEKYVKVNTHYLKSILKALRIELLIGPAVESIGLLLGCVFLIYCFEIKKIGLAEIVPLIVPLVIMYRPMKQITKVQPQIERGRAALSRIFSLLDYDCALPLVVNPLSKSDFTDKVSFQNVTFNYYNNSHPTVNDVSFDVPCGSVIAVVGGTGSGKTTLANLLARFYDVSSGSVTMDGVNVKDMDIADVRKLIGVVSQETILFNDTIANNIAYGTPDATQEQIEAASKMANAHRFIVEHEDGYERIAGEKGFSLSGGERQRIAIARAILKNPPILILDEATSALDTVTERLVQDAINKLMSNRTTFAIAHRLSTIKNATKIIVLEKGIIKESGTHDELYEQNGDYRKLCNMQMMD
ncbi:MAG: ABC transporter ATP-binding protein [Kiritimatiellae bacterium]|jgi:subfamily B ATP-binding cassette protein MsbA|nr:ABC transporter ATP-binding protein [Kiritimatiellia bacterium]